MEFIATIAIILIISMLMQRRIADDTKVDPTKALIIEKKECPPHKWEWQDITDQKGVKHGERVICLTCTKTPGTL